MDRRLTPANGRVAAYSLAGLVEAERFVAGDARQVRRPVVDLCEAPDGARERQLLLGQNVTCFEDRDGWSFVQSARDGYVGYVPTDVLGPQVKTTHRIATPATHAYTDANIKSRDLVRLSFGAEVTVLDERQKFFETSQGFIPKRHLRPLDRPFADPVTVAQLHFGVPYLWGGNSIDGIDCSGLVQAALCACDIPCPGDSDLQCDVLGVALTSDAPLQRGDLLFWEGHVAMMVDASTMIHANAHHMAVSYEPLTAALVRIEAQGDGAVVARKRL